MNEINVSGRVEKRSELKTSGNRKDFLLTFTLRLSNGAEIAVYCLGLLGKDISKSLKDGDTVTVMGKLENSAGTDGLAIAADVIFAGNDEVYPTSFPKQAAVQKRDSLERREKLRKAKEEAADPDDPF